MATQKPRCPAGLKAGGRRVWDDLTSRYGFDAHEIAVLTEIVRTVDLLDALDAVVRREGPLVTDAKGCRAHPAVVEARQARLTLAKLISALALPEDVDTGPALMLTASDLARRAARARWSKRGAARA